MSETKNKNEETEDKKEDQTKKKTLSLGGTLSLKSPVGSGSSAPSRSGGVAVEVKRKRSGSSSATTTPEEEPAAPPASEEESSAKGGDARHLTDSEREARIRALKQADEDAKRKKEEAKQKAESASKEEEPEEDLDPQEAARQKELEELERIEAEEAKKREEAKKKAQEESQNFAATSGPSFDTGAHKHRKDIDRADREEEESYRERMKRNATKKARTGQDRKRSGKLTVTQVLNEDYARDRGPSLAAQRRAREKARMATSDKGSEPPKKVTREVIVPETITVQELANRMAEPGGEVVKHLMKLGVMATINQTIDADTAELIIEELGHKIRRVTDADIEIGIEGDDDKEEDMQPRPPVVTIMGHVDHGKTSLLDALRATDVVAGEAGGITQHIGAYQVTMASGSKITFLDTPGHAAFTEMRARGANVTDIVVIVVAANDSIMPQTIEAINHAKAAEVPIIIAINKVDLPDADPAKVKADLLQHEVVVEDMSGDVLCIEVSAKQRLNLDKLEEAILLQSELLELKANPNRAGVGAVVEAKLEQGRGNVATILIEKGTLKVGDTFVVGAEYGRVRALLNDHGKSVDEAIPGQPVEVLGLNGAPQAGDRLVVIADEGRAREISEYRQRKNREAAALKMAQSSSFEHRLAAAREEGEKQTLSVIVKADVHGSAEALVGSLKKIEEENDDVIIRVLHAGVGGITESDTTLANASNALIIGFNVRANAQAREFAEREGIEIRYYNVIYNVIDDAKAVLSGMLEPTLREEYLGQAKIQQVFKVSKVGNIAGCMVTEGKVARGAKVRLLRDDVVIHEGTLKTLKRFKDEVSEVKEGTECGMAFENYDDIKENDVIECYEVIAEDRVLE